ncbi:MAG: CBS domain-containing protein [Phycisphaerae bacterium]|jgi:CBS domain-containing protein
MATSQTNVKSQTIELSTEAFEALCKDISGMFGVDMHCSQQQSSTETVEGLNKRFKELAAVNSVKSEGALDGKFQIVFDRDGLFTLAGVVVMMPEQQILDNRKSGSAKEANDMADAVGETGNLLVGSWDKVFREKLEGHGQFVKTNTFIGNPWDSPEEKADLAGDEEFLFLPYEMTVGSYPAFNCGVIFPKTIFDETSVSDAEPAVAEDEKSPEETEDQQDADEKAVEAEEKTAEEPVETEQETSAATEKEAEEPVAEVEDKPEEISAPADGTEPAAGPVSETIQKMVKSSEGLHAAAGLASLAMCAKDIMQKEVLWGNADDSVQQVLTKMQQADAAYMMVGTEGSLEGIVSTFDIAAAVSVYLKPMFAKWRRPIDDATLQIRIKWIMTKPVSTIKPDTPLTAIMENMSKSGLRCLPVTDEQGNVAGLVTVFDVFNALLNTAPGLSKTPQATSPA